jgi:hypothetical protein
MMTQPLWWRLSAGRRFAQGLADLQFKKRTRLLLVCGTVIRHVPPSRTITATSGSVHGATTWSCLIAPPSFPLVLAAGFLRAGSEAVDLATIALPTDKNLRAAATTQKQSARHFIGTVRHINPQPSAVSSSLKPRADRACRRARAYQGQGPSGGREDAASLDRPCARRLCDLAVGTEECSRHGSNKRMEPTYTISKQIINLRRAPPASPCSVSIRTAVHTQDRTHHRRL